MNFILADCTALRGREVGLKMKAAVVWLTKQMNEGRLKGASSHVKHGPVVYSRVTYFDFA